MDTPTYPSNTPIDERSDDTASSWADDLVDLVGTTSGHSALLVAWIATCGSLFFSEVLGWRPCVLCWYQRILMYPLAILIAIGIIRRDRGLHVYVLPFSMAGLGVSLYHYLLIKTDWLPPPACAVDVPCTVDYLNWFGFINIPFLALTAFVIITCMMLAFAWLQPLNPTDDDDEAVTEHAARAVPSTRWDTPTLAVAMIIVAVMIAFLLGSTFV